MILQYTPKSCQFHHLRQQFLKTYQLIRENTQRVLSSASPKHCRAQQMAYLADGGFAEPSLLNDFLYQGEESFSCTDLAHCGEPFHRLSFGTSCSRRFRP